MAAEFDLPDELPGQDRVPDRPDPARGHSDPAPDRLPGDRCLAEESPQLDRLDSLPTPVTLSAYQVRAAASAALPGQRVESLQPITRGAVGSLYEVRCRSGGRWVLKAYPHQPSGLMRREAGVLRRLAGVPEIPTPVLACADDRRTVLPVDYVVMSRLPGAALADARGRMAPDALGTVLGTMGRMLRAFHRVPYAPDQAPRQHHADCRLDRRLAAFTAAGGSPVVAGRLRDRGRTLVPGSAPASVGLCHGDFIDGNVLVAETTGGWRVTGIVDFERTVTGDVLYDMARTVHHLGRADERLVHAFGSGYGPLPPGGERALEVHRMSQALELWLWFARTREGDLLAAVDQELEDMASG